MVFLLENPIKLYDLGVQYPCFWKHPNGTNYLSTPPSHHSQRIHGIVPGHSPSVPNRLSTSIEPGLGLMRFLHLLPANWGAQTTKFGAQTWPPHPFVGFPSLWKFPLQMNSWMTMSGGCEPPPQTIKISHLAPHLGAGKWSSKAILICSATRSTSQWIDDLRWISPTLFMTGQPTPPLTYPPPGNKGVIRPY